MELLSKFCIKGMWIVKLFVAWTVAFNLFEALGLFLLLKTTLISQVLSGAKVHCYLLPCFSILVEIIVSYSLILKVLSGFHVGKRHYIEATIAWGAVLWAFSLAIKNSGKGEQYQFYLDRRRRQSTEGCAFLCTTSKRNPSLCSQALLLLLQWASNHCKKVDESG